MFKIDLLFGGERVKAAAGASFVRRDPVKGLLFVNKKKQKKLCQLRIGFSPLSVRPGTSRVI